MLVMSLLVFNFYASMLVSTLIGATSKNKIKTLENLADSDFRVGFDGDDISIQSFLNVRENFILISNVFFSFREFVFYLSFSVEFRDFHNYHKILRYISKTTDLPEHLYFIDRKASEWLFLSLEEGLRLVEQEQFAFHCESLAAYPVILKVFPALKLCDLNVLPFRKRIPMAFVVRKTSPFHSIFSIKYSYFIFISTQN